MKKATFTKTLSVAVSPSAFAQLKAISDKREISLGEMIRAIIDQELSRIRKEGVGGKQE